MQDDYTLYYHNLARLANKSGRLDLVIAAWQNALEINPNDDIARVQLDYALCECAGVKSAMDEANQTLADSPDDVMERYHLAENYLTLGYGAKAKAEWEKISARNLENWSKSARKMIRKHCWMPDAV
jgi:tetratricopeptide (TPR) repeat protein